MIVQSKVKLYVPCPNCLEGDWQVDHIPVGSAFGPWSCSKCHGYGKGRRLNTNEFVVEIGVGKKETPITVTLESCTEPKITLKLNTWKYDHSQKDTPEEFTEHLTYYYNEHTCPTNFMCDIEQIIFEGDSDPHGVFQFVSVEEGHFDAHGGAV